MSMPRKYFSEEEKKAAHNEAAKRYVTRNKEKRAESSRKYSQAHKPETAARMRRLRMERLEQYRAYGRKSDQRPERKIHNRVNAEKTRAKRLKRMAGWADETKIKAIYASCPEEMVVDHIIPLNGRNVSGLHIESNLQYLPRLQNSTKLNKFDFNEYKKTKHYKSWMKSIRNVQWEK